MIASCSYKKNSESSFYCKKLKLNCLENNETVTFITSKGDFDVELYGKNYPVTVSNFIENINNNIYRKKRFYKIINYPQVQIIHSGIYYGENYYKNTNKSTSIPLEIKLKKEVEPKYGHQIIEPSKIPNLKNIFEKGSLAMVKIGENNSSSTEFFFVTNKFPELDGRYTVFGKVIRGLEVLENIEKKDLIHQILIID